MEPAQLGPGLDADLVDQLGPGDAVRGERVGLAACAIEREHLLGAQSLAERVRSHQRVELSDDLRVPTAGKIGLDRRLGRTGAQLLQPADLRAGERLVGDIGERVAAPQRERLAGTPLRDQALEPERIDVAPVEPQLVPAAARHDQRAVAGERTAQVGDVGLHHLRRARRRGVTPQTLGEALGPDGVLGLEREHGEDGTLLAGAEGDRVPVQAHLRRP